MWGGGDNQSFCIYRCGEGVMISHSVFTDVGRGDNWSICIYRGVIAILFYRCEEG